MVQIHFPALGFFRICGQVQHEVTVLQIYGIYAAAVIGAVGFEPILKVRGGLGGKQIVKRTDDDKQLQQFGKFHELTLKQILCSLLRGRFRNYFSKGVIEAL